MGLAMLRRALEAVMLRSTQSAKSLSLGDTETDSMGMRIGAETEKFLFYCKG